MAFKYQVLLCPRPRDILLVTFNHLDAIKDFISDAPGILNQVDETFRRLMEVRVLRTRGGTHCGLILWGVFYLLEINYYSGEGCESSGIFLLAQFKLMYCLFSLIYVSTDFSRN